MSTFHFQRRGDAFELNVHGHFVISAGVLVATGTPEDPAVYFHPTRPPTPEELARPALAIETDVSLSAAGTCGTLRTFTVAK